MLPLNSRSLVRSVRFALFSLSFILLSFPRHHTPHGCQRILFTRLLKLSLAPYGCVVVILGAAPSHAVFGDASTQVLTRRLWAN